MTEYITEEEQLQRIKQLARQYLPAIALGLFLAFIFTSGWHTLQNYRNNTRVHASKIYETMLHSYKNKDQNTIRETAKTILKDYPKTVYANPADFMLAKNESNKNKLPEASKHLQAIIDRGKKTPYYPIAVCRLARIKIAQKNPNAALLLLKKINNPAFKSLVNLIRGDALLADNQRKAAAAAYLLTLQQLPETDATKILRNTLQMKYNSLA